MQLRGSVVRLGAGLLAGEGHKVVSSRVGRVKQGANSKLSIDNTQKRVSHTYQSRLPYYRDRQCGDSEADGQTLDMCGLCTVHPCSRGSSYRYSDGATCGELQARHRRARGQRQCNHTLPQYQLSPWSGIAHIWLLRLCRLCQLATLPALAFEGATKRNKPNLAVSHNHTINVPPSDTEFVTRLSQASHSLRV